METIITEKIYKEQEKNAIIFRFFKKFNVGGILAKSNFYKEKGTHPVELLKYEQKSISFLFVEPVNRKKQEYLLSFLKFACI